MRCGRWKRRDPGVGVHLIDTGGNLRSDSKKEGLIVVVGEGVEGELESADGLGVTLAGVISLYESNKINGTIVIIALAYKVVSWSIEKICGEPQNSGNPKARTASNKTQSRGRRKPMKRSALWHAQVESEFLITTPLHGSDRAKPLHR
jgi:hypothetical protein